MTALARLRPLLLLALAGMLWAGTQRSDPARGGPGRPISRGDLAPPWPLDPGGIERAPSALAQLRLADRSRVALRGRDEAGRERARREAIRAYRAVRARFPAASHEVALAALRAGRLACAGGDLGAAERELALAAQRAAGSPLAGRARLELGHVRRRAGDAEGALVAYEGALFDPATPVAERDTAWFWRGRVLEDLGRHDEARRSWTVVAERGCDPPLCVRAYDRLARSRIRAGDEREAARVVTRCRSRLEARAAEATELGRRTRSALARMLAPRLLHGRRRAAAPGTADAPPGSAPDISGR